MIRGRAQDIVNFFRKGHVGNAHGTHIGGRRWHLAAITVGVINGMWLGLDGVYGNRTLRGWKRGNVVFPQGSRSGGTQVGCCRSRSVCHGVYIDEEVVVVRWWGMVLSLL